MIMTSTYEIFITGHGHYKVDASISRVPASYDDLECEIEIHRVEKFDDMLENYDVCNDISEEEINLIERQIAIKFFNNLH
jgi:hypothetical protein